MNIGAFGISGANAALPSPARDIREFLPSNYVPYNSSVAHSGTDIAPTINSALFWLRRNFGRGVLLIPPGKFRIGSPLDTDYLAGNYIQGYGSQATSIIYDRVTGVCFRFTGNAGYTGGELRGLNIALEDGDASSGSYAIQLKGDATYQPGEMMFEDLYITALGSSYWFRCIDIDGTDKTTGARGVRVCHWTNVSCFSAHNVGISVSSAVMHTFVHLGLYTPKAASTGGEMYITGGGSAATNSESVFIQGLNIPSTLTLLNCSHAIVSGKVAGLGLNASATEVKLFGDNSGSTSGSLGTNSTNSMS